MSDEPKKTLMPEVLPRPVSFPGTAARARVISHLRVLAATGAATMTLAACPFLAVDPLPPPPRCRTTRGVAEDLTAFVGPGGQFTADAGEIDAGTGPDGGAPDRLELILSSTAFGSVDLTQLIFTSNTRRAELQQVGEGWVVTFEPLDPTQTVTMRFTTTCAGSAGVVLLATLSPSGGSYSAALTDAP